MSIGPKRLRSPSLRVPGPLLLALISILVLSFAFDLSAAQIIQTDSSITGHVLDSAGMALVGAVVAVHTAGETFRERMVFTDRSGVFTISGLAAGEYLIRVTKGSFLPTVARNVDVGPGASLVLTLNLQTALDIMRQGIRRGSLEDMKWVLRSSPSARPVLHLTEGAPDSANDGYNGYNAEGLPDVGPTLVDTEGYLQLYSSTVETSSGVADAVGSEFAFSVPLPASGQVTFAGQYSESQDQPRGFAAAYDISTRGGRRTSFALNVREGALLNSRYGREGREVQLGYEEQVPWSDRLVFSYGAQIGRSDGARSHNYIRPAAGITWVPGAGTTISAAFSRRAPIDATDPIRGREYFDRTVYIPSELERYSHTEFGVTQRLAGNVRVSAAAFRDVFGTQAFLVDSEDGHRGVVFFGGTNSPTLGVRFHVDRAFRNFEAGLGFTVANAVGFNPDVVSPDDLYKDAGRRSVHTVTARVKTDIERTRTAITAVYRWASGFSLAPVDPYQRFAEYNDPTLSITIAQDLPRLKIFPATFQAIVDARNLFEPSFGSRRTVYAGHPRLLKGGIHIRF
jgi:hypothetical protein